MYVQRNIEARSQITVATETQLCIPRCQQYNVVHWCHGNATVGSFALLSNYKIFRTAVSNINLTEFFLPWLRFFYPDWSFLNHDWSFSTLTEVFLPWLKFFLPWMKFFYPDWSFSCPDWCFSTLTEDFLTLTEVFLPWLRFFYPDWGFSVLFPQL